MTASSASNGAKFEWEQENGFEFRRRRPGAKRATSPSTASINGEAKSKSVNGSDSTSACDKENVRGGSAANENTATAIKTVALEKVEAVVRKRRRQGMETDAAATQHRKRERREKRIQERKLYKEIDADLPHAERLVALVQHGLACDGGDDDDDGDERGDEAEFKRAAEEVVSAARESCGVRYRENPENALLRRRVHALRLAIKVAQTECEDWDRVRQEEELVRPAIEDAALVEACNGKVQETEQVAQFAEDARSAVEGLVLKKMHAQNVIKQMECARMELHSRAQQVASRINSRAFVGAHVEPDAPRPPADVGLARVFATPLKD